MSLGDCVEIRPKGGGGGDQEFGRRFEVVDDGVMPNTRVKQGRGCRRILGERSTQASARVDVMVVHVLDPGLRVVPGMPLGHCPSKWRRCTETEPQLTGIEDDVDLVTFVQGRHSIGLPH